MFHMVRNDHTSQAITTNELYDYNNIYIYIYMLWSNFILGFKLCFPLFQTHYHTDYHTQKQRKIKIETKDKIELQICIQLSKLVTGIANFIDEWSHCDFCFTSFGVMLENLESSITMKKAIFRLSSTWSWHV